MIRMVTTLSLNLAVHSISVMATHAFQIGGEYEGKFPYFSAC